jgi:hypothetical protein
MTMLRWNNYNGGYVPHLNEARFTRPKCPGSVIGKRLTYFTFREFLCLQVY